MQGTGWRNGQRSGWKGAAPRRHTVILAVSMAATLALASCGGDDGGATAGTETTDPAGSGSTDAPGTEPPATGPPATDAPATEAPATDAPATDAPAEELPDGDIGFRVVNLMDEPVDLYVRTQGLVQAELAEAGVQPDAVTGLYFPPPDGTFVVTTAGAGDPECVIDCPHILVDLTATAPEGPVRTVVMYTAPEGDPFDEPGTPQSFDLWEDPTAERVGNSNSMPPADPEHGLFVTTAIAVADADFGLRLSGGDAGGCLESNQQGILVGGNQTPAFTYDGPEVAVSVHGNEDQECTEATVGGPFTVTGGPGTRTHLLLTGSSEAVDALIVPFVT